MEGLHRKSNRAWISTAKLDTEADFLKYIARLEAVPVQVKANSTISTIHVQVYHSSIFSSLQIIEFPYGIIIQCLLTLFICNTDHKRRYNVKSH